MKWNWKTALLLWILLALSCAWIFQAATDQPFIFDDIAKIRDNPDLHLQSFSVQNFIHDYSDKPTELHNDPSRPLTFIIYWLLWQISEGSAQAFHWTSLFLHLQSAWLLALITAALLRRLKFSESETIGAAIFAGLFYLALPLNTGTVVYAYGLSDVLSAFFCLLMFYLFLRKELLSKLDVFLLSLCFLAALASKQSALVMPAILLLTDLLMQRTKALRKNSWIHLTSFSLALLYLVTRWIYFGRLGDLEAYNTFEVPIYFPLQGIMIWKYFSWTWVPFHLAIDHAVTPRQFEYWQCILSWSAILLVSIGALWSHRKNKLAQVFAIGWFVFLLSLLPTSSFFPTTDLLVERRAYLAVAGLLMAFAAAVACSFSYFKSFWRLVPLSLLLAVFATNAWIAKTRVEIYKDEEALWKEDIELYPRNERARVNLSNLYLRQNDFAKAEMELSSLLQMYPNYYEAWANEGALYQHPQNPHRDLSRAFAAYQKVLAQEPNDLTALSNTGLLLMEMKRFNEALPFFQHILQLNPNLFSSRLHLAEVLWQLGKRSEARDQVQWVLQMDSGNSQAQYLIQKMKNQN